MEVIKEEEKLCLACMEVHVVKTIITDRGYYFEWCTRCDDLIETQEFIRLNHERKIMEEKRK